MISEPTMRTSSYGTALFLRFFITVKQDRLSNQVVKLSKRQTARLRQDLRRKIVFRQLTEKTRGNDHKVRSDAPASPQPQLLQYDVLPQ